MPDEAPNTTIDVSAPGTPAPEIRPEPPARVPASAVVSLDDGETPASVLEHAKAKIESRAPKKTVELPPRKDNGQFKKAPASKAAAPAAAEPPKPEPAKAAEPPKPPAPAAAPAPAKPDPATEKVKIGDKEYTRAELEEVLKKATQPPAAPAPKAEEPGQSGPTPEQRAAAEKRFIDEMAAKVPVDVSDAQLEAVLVGGKEGASAFASILKAAVARAILATRESIYADINPVVSGLQEQIAPLLQQNVEMERTATQQLFVQKYPEFEGHLDDATMVAEELLKRHPNEVRAMSREQFIDEVARQTNLLKEREFKKFYPTYQGSWKEWVLSQKAQPVAQPPAPSPAPAPPSPAPAPDPAPPKPKVLPPAANSPAAVTAGPKARDWQKSTAASLRD